MLEVNTKVMIRSSLNSYNENNILISFLFLKSSLTKTTQTIKVNNKKKLT